MILTPCGCLKFRWLPLAASVHKARFGQIANQISDLSWHDTIVSLSHGAVKPASMLAGERSGRRARLIRVAPPLVITKAEIDESVGILEKVLRGLQL